MTRKRLLVHGLVQGVGFRHHTRALGQRLGLRGWVRNRREGTVEALVEGEDEVVARFVAWCRQGPPAARVARVEVQDDEGQNGLGPFDVMPTA